MELLLINHDSILPPCSYYLNGSIWSECRILDLSGTAFFINVGRTRKTYYILPLFQQWKLNTQILNRNWFHRSNIVYVEWPGLGWDESVFPLLLSSVDTSGSGVSTRLRTLITDLFVELLSLIESDNFNQNSSIVLLESSILAPTKRPECRRSVPPRWPAASSTQGSRSHAGRVDLPNNTADSTQRMRSRGLLSRIKVPRAPENGPREPQVQS